MKSKLIFYTGAFSGLPGICVLLLVFSLGLVGCGFSKSKEDAEKALSSHFQALSTNGYTEALSGYDPQFFRVTPEPQWSNSLVRLNQKMGSYQNHSVTGWRVVTSAGSAGSGTTVVLNCRVNCSKKSSQETFTLFKRTGGSDYRIIGHQVDSAALLSD